MQFLLILTLFVSWIVVGYFLLGFLEYLANRWGYHEPPDGIVVFFCLIWPILFFILLLWLWMDYAPKKRIHALKSFFSRFNTRSPRQMMAARGKAVYEAKKLKQEQ